MLGDEMFESNGLFKDVYHNHFTRYHLFKKEAGKMGRMNKVMVDGDRVSIN